MKVEIGVNQLFLLPNKITSTSIILQNNDDKTKHTLYSDFKAKKKTIKRLKTRKIRAKAQEDLII